MEILGGTANIPQQFGIEFSMKLKPSNVFRSTKLHFCSMEASPCCSAVMIQQTFLFFLKDEGICKYLDGTQWI